MNSQRKYYTKLYENETDHCDEDYRDENYYRDATYYHDHEKRCDLGGDEGQRSAYRTPFKAKNSQRGIYFSSDGPFKYTFSNHAKQITEPSPLARRENSGGSFATSRQKQNDEGHRSRAVIHSPPPLRRHSIRDYGEEMRSPLESRDDRHEERDREGSVQHYPVQTRQYRQHLRRSALNLLDEISKKPLDLTHYEAIGPARLNIHRFRLPDAFHPFLDEIVRRCDAYANTRQNGWRTDLYSLTKQDIALNEVSKTTYQIGCKIVNYLARVTCLVYGIEQLSMDKNQPHVLKYCDEHKGVGLHHDKSDVTINVMLSRRGDYRGGGTYFGEAKRNVRLDFGEFLLHPGNAVHGGEEIEYGNRYVMVIFTNQCVPSPKRKRPQK